MAKHCGIIVFELEIKELKSKCSLLLCDLQDFNKRNEFLSNTTKYNALNSRIYTLRKKIDFLKRGLPELGSSADMGNVRFNDDY